MTDLIISYVPTGVCHSFSANLWCFFTHYVINRIINALVIWKSNSKPQLNMLKDLKCQSYPMQEQVKRESSPLKFKLSSFTHPDVVSDP
uniref:Uncharacterized protein n=1 Tax=Sinocyclocheilus grahami TaxID=75366 RepID=A0A672TF83_SINGR